MKIDGRINSAIYHGNIEDVKKFIKDDADFEHYISYSFQCGREEISNFLIEKLKNILLEDKYPELLKYINNKDIFFKGAF